MREDLLHFIWKHKKLLQTDLHTSKNEIISVIDYGMHNLYEGPDFFNAKVEIDGQLWAGNVEIHINASDWYAHHHETDKNYDNVILHVVWEDDATIFRKDNSEVPTLELKKYISKEVLDAYKKLFDKKSVTFINCEKEIKDIDPFLFQNWLERLYFERLERKSEFILETLKQSKNDWEKVLFCMLLKNFGLNINGNSFLSLAQALDFSVVRKLQNDAFQLESVFYGMANLLNDDELKDAYYIDLKKEYGFLKNKFTIRDEGVVKPDFFKLRPPNFPTIRLSQIANVYTKHQNVFSKLINANTLQEIYNVFNVSASSYWDNHYVFGKESGKGAKKLTKKFIDLLIINTILPIKFCYAKHMGKDVNNEVIKMATNLKREENSIIDGFIKLNVNVGNAMDSQAVLQLYNEYCKQNKCLQCVVGGNLLNRID